MSLNLSIKVFNIIWNLVVTGLELKKLCSVFRHEPARPFGFTAEEPRAKAHADLG